MSNLEAELGIAGKYIWELKEDSDIQIKPFGSFVKVTGSLITGTQAGAATMSFNLEFQYDHGAREFHLTSTWATFAPQPNSYFSHIDAFNHRYRTEVYTAIQPTNQWEPTAAHAILSMLALFNQNAAKDPIFAPQPGTHNLDCIKQWWDA